MAETQDATLGYMGEFWLWDADATTPALYELQQVKEFDVAAGGNREQIEKTHLKSPNWRREYLSGFYEDNDIEILLNSRPMSDTDVLLQAANDGDETLPFLQVLPENGVPSTQISGTCRVTGYNRGRVTADGVMEATATVRIVTVDAIAEYAAP